MDRLATAIARAPPAQGRSGAPDRTARSAEGELEQLRRLVDTGVFAAALELAARLQGRPRVHRDVPILVATALAEQGRLGEARALLERLVRLVPDEPAYAANLTRVLFPQEDWPAAWAG